MLAKVSFNGENHLAIVLNERMGYDWLGEIKSGSPDKLGGKILNFPEKVIPLCHE